MMVCRTAGTLRTLPGPTSYVSSGTQMWVLRYAQEYEQEMLFPTGQSFQPLQLYL